MATKTERFKTEVQRLAQNAHRAKKRPAPAGAEGDAARVELVVRHNGAVSRIPHNTAARASKRSAYELEAGGAERPPRRSTRKSPTHLKPDSGLHIRAIDKATSPEARAARSKPRG
ncbi:MAG TPA: hypothetical protein VG319_07810 [Polyangia bacterium]|nr:hypothetical protein [Polyangia bacterium]